MQEVNLTNTTLKIHCPIIKAINKSLLYKTGELSTRNIVFEMSRRRLIKVVLLTIESATIMSEVG